MSISSVVSLCCHVPLRPCGMTAGLECSSCGRVYNPTADTLRASLAAAEAKLAEERAEHAATRSIAEQHAHRLSVDLADERARYEALVGAVDPGPCPCCGDDIHSGHSLDCTFADDCPEEARAWDRIHEAIASNAARRQEEAR